MCVFKCVAISLGLGDQRLLTALFQTLDGVFLWSYLASHSPLWLLPYIYIKSQSTQPLENPCYVMITVDLGSTSMIYGYWRMYFYRLHIDLRVCDSLRTRRLFSRRPTACLNAITLKNSMFVNISSVMMDCYPISEWEEPFNWEWLVGNSFKTITSFAYFREN